MICKQFWGQIVLSIAVIVSTSLSFTRPSAKLISQAGMIISTTSIIPYSYRVDNIEALVPLSITYICHLIWPFVLDPYFTTFTVSLPSIVEQDTLTTYSSSFSLLD